LPVPSFQHSQKLGTPLIAAYLTSLCGVCLRQRRQNFLNSSRSVVVFRFLVVE
jgi:hypothetical protein